VLQKTPIRTCHCDPHLDNFVYCDETGKLTLFDLQIMRPFPVGYDLAFHFATYESVMIENLNQVLVFLGIYF